MPLNLTRIEYLKLNARQKENYNYLKVSAVLAEYGFVTMRLTDDWQGADFIAQHIDGDMFLKVQLKSRLSFSKKYLGKDLYIAFFNDPDWYLYPHDEVLKTVLKGSSVAGTNSWDERGGYSFSSLSKPLVRLLEPFKIGQPKSDGAA
jgi:hypothetical protein